ncbi:MAG: DUF971 domain-containing protein [Pirellulaceae bacterium]|nr:DUF971 domain-containing protein [Mariniblastus sp.]MDB4755728.1 DUF971 domain-containing protein [Mariniblastus sp.]MDG2468734.1 DUF971 domain-containing protein [Pirellulaceae bacterium]
MNNYPAELKIENDYLVVRWSDSTSDKIAIRDLRDSCPCANCREQRSLPPQTAENSLLPIVSSEQKQLLTIRQMRPVGNYAYSITFSDGHSNGIFTFDFLYSMGNK